MQRVPGVVSARDVVLIVPYCVGGASRGGTSPLGPDPGRLQGLGQVSWTWTSSCVSRAPCVFVPFCRGLRSPAASPPHCDAGLSIVRVCGGGC